MTRFSGAHLAQARRTQSQFARVQTQIALKRTNVEQVDVLKIKATIAAMNGRATFGDVKFPSDTSTWGAIAVGLHRSGVPGEIAREVFYQAWRNDHYGIIRACKKNGMSVMGLFRAYKCPAVDELPETFTVWRGARDVRLEVAIRGFSWTTNRAAACYYACRRHNKGGQPTLDAYRPIVVKREIARDKVVFYSQAAVLNSASVFSEVVFDAPACGEVDGTPYEWREEVVDYLNEMEAKIEQRNRLECAEA